MQGGSLIGVTEKPELITLCAHLESQKLASDEQSSDLDSALKRKAMVIDARLRCVDVLQTVEPDTVDLSWALEQSGRLDLDDEPCGQALLAHSSRLCMRAEETVDRESATIAELEEAADVLEAAKRICAMLEGEPPKVDTPSRKLEHANQRWKQARQEKKQMGIRCVCGTFAKLTSVSNEVPFSEARTQIASRWGRPAESLSFFWSDGTERIALDSEEEWQRCLRTQRKDPIELEMIVARAQGAKSKNRKPKVLSRPSTRDVDQRPNSTQQRKAVHPQRSFAESQRPGSQRQAAKPDEASQLRPPVRSSLAGLAASSKASAEQAKNWQQSKRGG